MTDMEARAKEFCGRNESGLLSKFARYSRLKWKIVTTTVRYLIHVDLKRH